MSILGIPHVVVLKPVHVHLQPTIVVEVHVGNEELCTMSSVTPSFDLLLETKFQD